MTPPPRVSIVIPFFNSARHFRETIDSVRAQTFQDWEMILVGSAPSTDGSTEMARRWEAESGGKIRVLVHEGPENMGIFSARVWGAREARAPLLAMHDSDDLWSPYYLARQEALYRAMLGDRPGMVHCALFYGWEDPAESLQGRVGQTAPPALYEAPDALFHFFKGSYEMSAGTPSTLMARQIVVEAGALAGDAAQFLADEQYLWSHAGLRYPIVVNPEPMVWYRQWPGSTCARQKSDAAEVRRRHLAWFLGHAEREYAGPRKEELLRTVRGWLREAERPPGPLASRIRKWRRGLARRIAG